MTSVLQAVAKEPSEKEKPMAEHHRDTDNVVSHFRAADSGVSMFWRWGNMLVTLIGFGVVIGIYYSNFGWMRDQITEIRSDQVAARKDNAELRQQAALDHQELLNVRGMVDDLKKENGALRGQIDTMRNMREAYVYANANRRQPNPTPP